MTAYARREITGGAVATTLSAGIASGDASFSIVTTTGWPTGGANGDFFVVIDRGTANEEKVLCASRSAGSITVQTSGRGVDGTSQVAHASGASVEHCLFARDADEANLAVSKTISKATAQGQILVVDAANSFAAVQGKTSGQLLMGDGTTVASLAMSGDVTITGAGVTTIGASKITSAKIVDATITGTDIAATTIAAANIANATITDVQVAAANKDGVAGTASMRTLGTASTQAAAGNDARLSDTRTPSVGSVTQATHATGLRAHNVTSSIAPASPIAGDLWFAQTSNTLNVYNGTAWVCITPQSASDLNTRTTASTSYVTLTGAPSVTLATGTTAWVTVGAYLTNSTVSDGAAAGVVVSGASTIAAADNKSFFVQSVTTGQAFQGSYSFLMTGLTAGNNTFTVQGKAFAGGTATIQDSALTVVGIPG